MMGDKKVVVGPVEFKGDGEKGEFRAVFSTFNVVDKDGDVTLPGAFKDGQETRISYWGHRWGDLPVGKGVIHQDEKEAWVDGQFFLDTEGGVETYKTVRNLGGLQEWSYGYDVLESSFGKFADQDVRFLKQLEVPEVSPVMLGAGINTRTLVIKGTPLDPPAGGGKDLAADGVKVLREIHALLDGYLKGLDAADGGQGEGEGQGEAPLDPPVDGGKHGGGKLRTPRPSTLAAELAAELLEM